LYQNVTIFDGRDACSTNVWKVDDFEAGVENDNNDTTLMHIITYLKPYTQYALYVKTYTIASEKKGAQSDILYFKTQPDSKYSSIFINSSLICQFVVDLTLELSKFCIHYFCRSEFLLL
jgi:hypothetical protein